MIGVGDDQKAANVSQSCGLLHQTFVDNTSLGERLVPAHYRQPSQVAVGCAVVNIVLVLCHLHTSEKIR